MTIKIDTTKSYSSLTESELHAIKANDKLSADEITAINKELAERDLALGQKEKQKSGANSSIFLRVLQVLCSIVVLSQLLSFLMPQSITQHAISLLVLIITAMAIYAIQKKINKTSTAQYEKNYRLIYVQIALLLLSIMQFVSAFVGADLKPRIMHGVLFLIFSALIVLVQKRINKNKSQIKV